MINRPVRPFAPLHERSVVSNASTFDKESLGRPALDRNKSVLSPFDIIVGISYVNIYHAHERMSSLGRDVGIIIFAPHSLIMCERESGDAHAGATEYIETQRGVVRISCWGECRSLFF